MWEMGAGRKGCAEMCEGWGRKGREEWERDVGNGGEGVKGWVLSEKGVVGRVEDGERMRGRG